MLRCDLTTGRRLGERSGLVRMRRDDMEVFIVGSGRWVVRGLVVIPRGLRLREVRPSTEVV
jgi:hypothetical protein